MTKNPFYNAGLAVLYIVLVVLLINFGLQLAGSGADSNLLAPIEMIFLSVVLAPVMAYIVLYQPIIMFLDGKHNEA